MRRTLIAAALVVFIAGAAAAHFQLNLNLRVIHIIETQEGLRVLMRLPMVYALANVAERDAEGQVQTAPYARTVDTAEQRLHYLDTARLRADPQGLASLVRVGHVLQVNRQPLKAQIVGLRLWAAGNQPPFASLAEAEAAFAKPFTLPPPETYIGDTVVDVELHYPAQTKAGAYQLHSTLRPAAAGADETANLILDYIGAPARPRLLRIRGLLDTPVELGQSLLAALGSFTRHGIRHILSGMDHVLFVICLVLGATGWALIARITGFTIGHSLTLALGFFGATPDSAWFIPLVEWLIAVSVVYAGSAAWFGRSHLTATPLTIALGLLHGLGFAFILRDLLPLESAHLWPSLLAFNIGVELGQIALALGLVTILTLLARTLPRFDVPLRRSLALGCAAIAAFWVAERGLWLIQSL